MPFLRVIRDKRGYETTYLMHWFREGHRQHSRILYIFRTPGGVRVGRDPFDPQTLRTLEHRYPDIVFDWNVVRDNQQVIESSVEPRRRRPRPEEPPVATVEPQEVVAIVAPKPDPPVPPPPRLMMPSRIQGNTPDERIAFLVETYAVVRGRILQRAGDAERQEALLALAERLNPTTWVDADQIAAGLEEAARSLERLSQIFTKRRRRARKRPAAPSPQP